MSGSRYAPLWRRILNRVAPFLFSTCPGYNKHWWHSRFCVCIAGTNGAYFAIKHRGEWFTVSGQYGGIDWSPRAPWNAPAPATRVDPVPDTE